LRRLLLLLALLELLHQVHHGVCHLLVHAGRRAIAHATTARSALAFHPLAVHYGPLTAAVGATVFIVTGHRSQVRYGIRRQLGPIPLPPNVRPQIPELVDAQRLY